MEENGRVLEVLDSKPDSRRIKIKSIAMDRNLADMASEIVEKCKYIHPSRVEEVEQLLIQLNKINREKEAKEAKSSAAAASAENTKSKKRDKHKESSASSSRENHERESSQTRETMRKPKVVDEGPPASMDNLDDYLELLYQVSGKNETDNDEGLRAQIEGTAMILKLCRVVVNLEILIQNNTVMGALTRVLQEEFKKSSELTFNILRSTPPRSFLLSFPLPH
jgi:G3E family GTPase